MYTEIKSAIESVKVISDILQASHDLRNFNELASAVSELNTKLLSATSAALAGKEKEAALGERVRLLEQEIMQFRNWEATAQNYTLKEVASGMFAYVYTSIVKPSEVRHWICVKCFHEHKICILQSDRKAYFCQNCQMRIAPIKDGRLVHIDEAY